jgi:Subtilase family
MKRRMGWAGIIIALLWAAPTKADTGVIVRTTNLQALQVLCALPTTCTVVGGLDGTLGQLFLITTPLPLQTLLGLLQPVTGFVSAEVDQVISLVGPLLVPSPLPATLMQDRTLVPYPANSMTMVWNSYANQQASAIVEVQKAQSTFNVTGTGIVADIDTGVDPNHPALQGVLLPGYDYTRNQPNGSELNDVTPCPFSSCPPPPCSSTTCPAPAQVNQSTAAVLDQSTAAVLDTNAQYAAFGHGTMVLGIVHLVAPTATLLPLKAFKSDGTGALSDILRAIYDAVQKYNANVINMSFDFKTASQELSNALTYASGLGTICASSAGNDGMQETVFPAALQSLVMGVASVGSTTATESTRSSFSNYGNAIVWVAAPGEAIVSTYPYDTYASGWGTSFSAPFVSGGGALLRGLKTSMNQPEAAAAVAHAAPLTDPGMGNGRLDLVPALQSVSGVGGSPDYSVSAAPSMQTIPAGATANYTVSAAPANGFNQTVTWSCTGAPSAAACTVSPPAVVLDGSNPASATVTLTTLPRAVTPPVVFPRSGPRVDLRLVLIVGLAWLLLVLIRLNLNPASRRQRSLALAGAVVIVALCTHSCGGGYGTVSGPVSPVLSAVTLTPGSVNGGSSSTGTVTLSGAAPTGGVTVNLSSNSSSATVPSSVTVAAGSTSATFSVNTSAVTASTPVTISASYAGVTMTASLTVMPSSSSPTLTSITLNPSSLTGGSPSTGTVTLSGAAPTGGVTVNLSSNSTSATVPSSVTVAAGSTSATFSVNTSAVTASTPVTISASYAGVTMTASLTVMPPGTPAGTYTLTITGTSGNLSHSTTVQVTVK